MTLRSLILGFVTGCAVTAAGFYVTRTLSVLDEGISTTYLSFELETLQKASDVTRKMAEPHWRGLSRQNATARPTEPSLFDFAKGDEGLVADPVFLKRESGYIAEIQTHCHRLPGADCEQKGTN
ncbi:hypothetical protein OS190_10845 [Sulfitobacter sp. F26204]|uniref:hypothetical protein n=1 Tax=Sulfitobacter sp. F26204 TaxID=2996014 RepID=UPI00225DF4FF|nr:hypothetical protein [Sulfitobacter sp. F26204]MCX7560065.1 hypothetical protein [Sulfitobacter sp. F26204]